MLFRIHIALAVFLFLCLLPASSPALNNEEGETIVGRVRENTDQALSLMEKGACHDAAKAFEKSLLTLEGIEGSLNPYSGAAKESRENRLNCAFWTATCYRLAACPDESLLYYRKSMELSARLKRIHARIQTLLGMARVHASCGAWRECGEDLKKGEEEGFAWLSGYRGPPAALTMRDEYWTVASDLRRLHLFSLMSLYVQGKYEALRASAEAENYANLHQVIKAALKKSLSARGDSPVAGPADPEELWMRWDLERYTDEYEYQIPYLKGRASRCLNDISRAREFFLAALNNVEFSSSAYRNAAEVRNRLMAVTLPLSVFSEECPGLEFRNSLTVNKKITREIEINLQLAAVYSAEEKIEEAESRLRDARDRCSALPFCGQIYRCRTAIAEADFLNRCGRSEKALSLAQGAIADYGMLGIFDPHFIVRACGTLGESCEKMGYREDAMKAFRRGIEYLNFIAPFPAGSSPRENYEDAARCYQGVIRVLKVQQRPLDSLFSIEAFKNACSVNLTGPLPYAASMSEERLRDLRYDRACVTTVATRMGQILENPQSSGDMENLITLGTRLREGIGRFNAFIASSDEAFQFQQKGAPLAVEAIQGRLGESSAVLCYYYETAPPMCDRECTLWVITRESCCSIPLNITGKTLENDISLLLSRVHEHSQMWQEVARRLYIDLIDPARQYLDGKTDLIIVPHGDLFYIPFAALTDSRGRNLAERFTLTHSPSLTLCRSSRPTGAADLQILQGKPSTHESVIDPLKRLFPTREISDFSLFAAGVHESGSNRHLLFLTPFAFRGRSWPDSGFQDFGVTPDRIVDLDMRSACTFLEDSSVDPDGLYGGGDVAALYGAFRYAGAPSLIFSLWNVPAGDEWVKEFYRNLKTCGNATALRKAQQTLRARYPLPYFWASYVIYGE